MRQQVYLLYSLFGFILIAFLFFYRSDQNRKTQFRKREADRKLNFKKLSSKQTDALAHQKQAPPQKPPTPLTLEGIRLDQPPHAILGVKENATEVDIQKAYKLLMKRYHPDQIGRPGTREWQDAQKISEAINLARTQLLDRIKKNSRS
jgi:DnaJ-domain-containing protein 1